LSIAKLVTTPRQPCSMRSPTDFGSPLPNAGEGVGGEGWVRGIPMACVGTRNPALDVHWGALQFNQPCARPLTPGPSPALGRGELKSIVFPGGTENSSPYSEILARTGPPLSGLRRPLVCRLRRLCRRVTVCQVAGVFLS
jgi:hypothetical protein